MNHARIAPLALIFLSLPVQAGDSVFPYPTEVRTLDNGLEVVVVPMSSPGVAAWTVWMSVGSRDEVTAGRTGFAHFFEHLMFYGTEELGMAEREQRLLELAVQENAWTWLDETVYHAVLPAQELPTLIELESGRFQGLYLTPDAVKREAGAVYGELRKSQASADGRTSEALYGAAFSAHTYKHDTLGYEADIARYPDGHDDAMAFFSRFYRPDRARILVAGDVKPDEVFAAVEKSWSGWTQTDEPRPELPAEPPQTERRDVTVDWPSETATHFALGWHIPASTPDNAAVAALHLIDQLVSSPVDGLKKQLVDDAGLAYSVEVRRDDTVDPGLFSVHLTLKEGVTPAQVEPLVLDALRALTHNVDPKRLDLTRSHARYRFLSSLDDPERVVEELGWAMRRAGTTSAFDTWFATVDAVTPAALSEVADEVFVPTNLTTVTLGHKLPNIAEPQPEGTATEGGAP